MNYLILVLKGFFVGIALIIPGLSGGTLAMYMGIYEELLHAIGNVFHEMKKSLQFLIPVFFGMALSVISLAKLLGYLIDINSLIILVFFMGLILGGAKDIYQKANPERERVAVSSIVSFSISFLLIIVLIIFGKINVQSGISTIDINLWNMILLFLLGMAASMTMIVPGISGSALLIVLGYYTLIVTNVVGEILDFSMFSYNIQILIPFALGAGLGIILFSRVIEFLLQSYQKQTYFGILGFILASVIAIFFEIKDPNSALSHDLQTPIYRDLFSFLGDNILSLFIAIVLFIIGFVITRKLVKLESK